MTEAAALQLALAHSPALQVLLAEGWRAQAEAAQRGAPPNPFFLFERVVTAGDVDITRLLGIGLTELLTWPWRSDIAQRDIDALRLQLAREVLAHSAEVRAAWVRAVAAQQLARLPPPGAGRGRGQRRAGAAHAGGGQLQPAAARARAGLPGRRDHAAGARHGPGRRSSARRWCASSAWTPTMPSGCSCPIACPTCRRCPGRATRWRSARWTSGSTCCWRARSSARRSARWGWRRCSCSTSSWPRCSELGPGGERGRGFEAGIGLPLLDPGIALRQASSARLLAAQNRFEQVRIEAGSVLRERYVLYRSAHDVARHQRDEVVPLKRSITDEMLLKYNGMLVGVFELLADARAQVGAVIAAIEAQRDFWLADAALNAAIVGAPSAATPRGRGHASAAAERKGH